MRFTRAAGEFGEASCFWPRGQEKDLQHIDQHLVDEGV